MHPEFSARRLDSGVDLPGRNPNTFGDELEVMDQALHRGAHDLGDVLRGVAEAVGPELQIGRPGQLLVGDHHRTRFQALQTLLDDPE